MERLTARSANGLAYLLKVKPEEQAVDSKYPNTLRAILESFQRLAAYEDLNRTPAELAADLTRLDAYDRMIESGELIWRADVTAKYRAMKERRDV